MNKSNIYLAVILMFISSCSDIKNNHEIIDQHFAKLIPYSEDNKWGFLDRKKDIIIPAKYDQVSPFIHNASVVTLHGKQGLIDTNGTIIFPIKCDEIYYNIDADYKHFSFEIADKMGLISNKGQLVIDTLYDFISKPYYNIVVAKNYELNTADIFEIDHYKKILSINNSHVYHFSHNKLIVRNGDELELISLNNERISLGKYEYIEKINEGLAPFQMNKKGFMDENGEIIIKAKYVGVTPFKNGFASVRTINNKYFIINKKGSLINKNGFDYIGEFSYGLAPVKLSNRWGYIDTLGNIKFDLQFEYASNFRYGLAVVKKNNMYGILDLEGNLITKFIYKKILDYYDNITCALTDAGWVVLDTNGTQILSDSYNCDILIFKDCITHVEGINGNYLNNGGVYIDINGTQYFP